jgi:hypothetical protein
MSAVESPATAIRVGKLSWFDRTDPAGARQHFSRVGGGGPNHVEGGHSSLV